MQIDQKLLEQTYGAEALIEIAKAFKIFEEFALYELIIESLKRPIVDSFDSNADELAKRIVSVQQTTKFLLTMKETGKQISERYNPNA